METKREKLNTRRKGGVVIKMLNRLRDIFKSGKEKVHDPVCGMEKEKSEFKFTSEYQGKTYYFCSEQCKHMFEAEPRGYVGE